MRSPVPRPSLRHLPLRAALGMSALSFALLLAAALGTPGFDWVGQNLSDLGLPPPNPLFTGSLLLGAAGGALVVLGLRDAPRAGRVLAGAGFACLAGVAAVDERFEAHRAFAAGYFFLTPLGLLVLGWAWRGERRGTLATGAGLLALAGFLALAVPLRAAGGGLALPEALQALVLTGWLAAEVLRRERLAP